MHVITDFHLHSKYSRACSKQLTLPNIAKGCERKGIGFVGTSDAFHPGWQEHIREVLEESHEGTFVLKDHSSSTHFLLSTEISCIYKRHNKVRRVHHIILFPHLQALERLTSTLNTRGCNLKSDGRPIVGVDSEELLKMMFEASPDCMLIPAHAWTPWFGLFGSQSGFDTLEECFGDFSSHIHAIETGLSSDPLMNWRLSRLDGVFLVSNSDAHSVENLGREANVFEMERPSYVELKRILTEQDTPKFVETIEFFPEEGKYHADGHRSCSFWCEPEQTKKMKGVCPRCGKPLTIGVLHRVSDLADREPHPPRPLRSAPYRSIVPLAEVVSSVVGVSPKSKRVGREIERMLKYGRSEFALLLNVDEEELRKIASSEIAEAVLAVRRGDLDITPGYDGEYGVIRPRINLKKKSRSRYSNFISSPLRRGS